MKFTDEEKKVKARESAKEWRKHHIPIGIPKSLAETFENERKKYEETLPFAIKRGQFVAVILDHWVKTYGHA